MQLIHLINHLNVFQKSSKYHFELVEAQGISSPSLTQMV